MKIYEIIYFLYSHNFHQVAKLPQIASQVYYRAFRDSNASPPPSVDPSLDWVNI